MIQCIHHRDSQFQDDSDSESCYGDPHIFTMSATSAAMLYYDAVVNNELANLKKIVELYKIDLNAKFTEVRKAQHIDLGPIHLAAYKGYPKMLQYLVEQKCDVNLCTSTLKRQAIHYSALKHQMACLRKLLNAGAQVNARDTFGNSPIHYAADDGNSDILRELINRGADVNLQDITWKTPLMKATRNGKFHVTELLLKTGCDVNIKDKSLDTALHFATRNSSLRILQRLLEKGGDVNVQNRWGLSPLMEAVRYNQRDAVSLLITFKCDLFRREIKFGDTALHIAVKKNYSLIVDMLLSACGWETHIYNYNRESLLHDAAIYNRIDIIKLFLYRNFDLEIPGKIMPNQKTKSVFQLALEKGNLEICKLLADAFCCSFKGDEDVKAQNRYSVQFDVEGVKSLKQWSRKVIRKSLGYNINEKAPVLPLPDVLKDYVLLKDLGVGAVVR